MLDKLRVELSRRCSALPPIQNEFRDRLFYEVSIDIGPCHNLHGILTWVPIAIQGGRSRLAEGFGLVLLLMTPFTDDMLAKFVFPGVAHLTSLSPVENEILQLR